MVPVGLISESFADWHHIRNGMLVNLIHRFYVDKDLFIYYLLIELLKVFLIEIISFKHLHILVKLIHGFQNIGN